MNTQPTLTFSESLQVAYSELKAIPINLLDTRQERLVDLLVSIVNEVTDNGKATSACTGVVDQDYWCNLMQVSNEVGFKYLGAGHFSAAFSHPMLPKRVIKIGFKKEDSGAAYTAWCRANQGRAGVPVIHAVSRSAGCYTVVLDKLDEFEYQKPVTDYYGAIREVINGDTIEAWDNLSIELIKTSQDIRKFFKGIAKFDIHRGNVMIHPDTGHLVITDPVSFSEDIATKEAPLDFDELVKEIAATHAKSLIEKFRKRHAWNHGGKIVDRKKRRQRKVAHAKMEKYREAKRKLDAQVKRDVKVLGRNHDLVVWDGGWLAPNDARKILGNVLKDELNVRRSDARLQHVPNRVAKIDCLLNNEFLLENQQTPLQPSWGKLFGVLEAKAVGRILRQQHKVTFKMPDGIKCKGGMCRADMVIMGDDALIKGIRKWQGNNNALNGEATMIALQQGFRPKDERVRALMEKQWDAMRHQEDAVRLQFENFKRNLDKQIW